MRDKSQLPAVAAADDTPNMTDREALQHCAQLLEDECNKVFALGVYGAVVSVLLAASVVINYNHMMLVAG